MRPPGWHKAGLLLPLLSALAGGCGDVDAGSAPFVGAVRYQDPAGAYAFSLLEPPWIPISINAVSITVFVVPPSDATVPTDLASAISMALYSLQIERPTVPPAEAMAEVIAGLPKSTTVGPTNVTTASGAGGVELAWQESDTVYHRDAFIAGTGATFQLHFTGRHPLDDDAMLTQMIESFQPQ